MLWGATPWRKTHAYAYVTVEGIPRNLPISVLTYDPNNPNIFYAGTGEIYTGGDSIGNGLWKSTDSGNTWEISQITLGGEAPLGVTWNRISDVSNRKTQQNFVFPKYFFA